MGFTGNLKTLSFGDILQLISTGKKTGVLQILRTSCAKKIYFRGGNIIAAASHPSTIEERLGQVLTRKGLLSPEDLDKALKKHRSSGKRLGQVLIETGLLDRTVILDSLRAQVEEVVYSVFAWTEAEFRFLDDEAPDSGQILVELNTMNVMMEGARRFDEYAEVAHDLPSGETVLRMCPAPRLDQPSIVLSADDVEVLAAVDGERSLLEILSTASNGEYSASKSLHKLVQSKLVEPCPNAAERSTRRGEEEQVYDLIYRLYSHALQALHKAFVEQLGMLGERLFSGVPDGWDSDKPELLAILTAGADGSEESFRKEIVRIAEPIRLHRVLALANCLLSAKVRMMIDRVGPRVAGRIVHGIQKDLIFLLAQKRSLADKYDIGREFRQALQGA
jgi:predicted transcriptional regulator